MSLHPELGYFDEGLNLTDPRTYSTVFDVEELASILPPVAYRSRIFAELEDEKLWTRLWCCVGTEQQLSEVGDLLPYTLGNHGIHVQKNKQGYSGRFNFAQHGGCRFVPAQCQTGKKTKCSYTSCGYSRDRDVIRFSDVDNDTPILRHFVGDMPERMLPVQVETLGGCIFVNVDQNSHSLGYQTQGIDIHFEATLRNTLDQAGFWQPLEGNWKVGITSIFEIIQEQNELDLIQINNDSSSSIDNTKKSEFLVAQSYKGNYENYLIWLFPNLLIAKQGSSVARIIIQPTGLNEAIARVRLSIIDGLDNLSILEAKELEEYWKNILCRASRNSKNLHQTYEDWGTPASPDTCDDSLPKSPSRVGYLFQQYLVDRLLAEYNYVWNAPLYTDARR